MNDNFIKTINYLSKLKQIISDEESNLTTEQRLLLTIEDAILSDKYHSGSIIFTKDNDNYYVSNVQKRSYAWQFKGENINLENLRIKLSTLGITNDLLEFNIKNRQDYELTFEVTLEKPKIKSRGISIR